MDRNYSLNDLALMTGFTTRTLRNYIKQGLLNGEKQNGVWQFTADEIDRFFREPFVKEGLRIKQNSTIFDFMANRNKTQKRSCVILDIPSSVKKGNEISAFFCDKINDVEDVMFNYSWDNGTCRVILTGVADSVAEVMKIYSVTEFDD